MYERFTDRARKVMQLANHEAQRFNREYIGTEHILLGLMKEDGSIAANVLKNMDVSLQTIRNEIEAIVASGPEMVTMGRLPQTPRAKKVVELAVQSAQVLNHGHVGTEHLLLGLIKEGEGIACQVLKNLGVIAEDVTEEILNLLGRKAAEGEKAVKEATAPTDALSPVLVARYGSPANCYFVFALHNPEYPSPELQDQMYQAIPDVDICGFYADLKERVCREERTRYLQKFGTQLGNASKGGANAERFRCLVILKELSDATESAAAKAAYLLAVKRICEDGTEKKENGK